jgi:hypothetical protein
MDTKALIEKVDAATKTTANWATAGWPVTFGNRNTPVNSLPEAEATNDTFVNRQEALSYWKTVAELGRMCVTQGEKAKAALESGDIQAAADAVYYAKFWEHRLNKELPTWGAVSDELHSLL